MTAFSLKNRRMLRRNKCIEHQSFNAADLRRARYNETMIKDMTVEQIWAEYSELLPIKTMPGERSWVHRLNSWELFLKMGQKVADHLRIVYAYHLREYDGQAGADLYEKEFRGLHPERMNYLC